AVDALDEGDAEFAVIDAPELHAAVRVVRTDVVDAGHERAALDLDVEPRPLLDRAFRACVRHVVDSAELRHRSFSFRVIRLASARTRRARSRCGRSSIRPSSDTTPLPGEASKTATMRRARSTSSAPGRKISFAIATWSGWIS